MARNREAGTAFGPIVLSAVEYQEPTGQRLVDDDLATLFLPLPLRMLIAATRWAPLRRNLIRASERSGPGLWASIVCRKRYVDDLVAAALGEVDAVVVLGAGLDTRAYRLARQSDIPVFEVDLPINVARKRNVVARVLGALPPSVHLVAVDFERDDLVATLTSSGYDADARTFFIWEGVTQYLTADAVATTFDELAGATPGSRLVFTYVRQDFIDGQNMYGAPGLYRRFRARRQVWKSGLNPDDVGTYLDRYGWRLLEQAGPDEFAARYVTPAGRALRTSELEFSVYAEKNR